MRTFASIDELKAAQGEQLGTSDWLTLDQERVNQFAEATGDHQWIHVDEARAADGPFGQTIAHGFLTLALLPVFGWEVYQVENVKMTINYGLNKVRFTSPVPVGSKVRGSLELAEVSEVSGGVQVMNRVTVEIKGSQRPACVAESLMRYYG